MAVEEVDHAAAHSPDRWYGEFSSGNRLFEDLSSECLCPCSGGLRVGHADPEGIGGHAVGYVARTRQAHPFGVDDEVDVALAISGHAL